MISDRIAPIAVALLIPLFAAAEALPRIEGENLNGKTVTLPDAAAGRIAVLIAGFTHASQKQTKPWDEKLEAEFKDPAKIAVYPIADLESAPRFVRGMAIHGMKSGTPKSEYDRFLVVTHHSDDLKRAAGFAAPDDAYIVLLDLSGEIRWRFHGPVTDATLQELKAHVSELDKPAAN